MNTQSFCVTPSYTSFSALNLQNGISVLSTTHFDFLRIKIERNRRPMLKYHLPSRTHASRELRITLTTYFCPALYNQHSLLSSAPCLLCSADISFYLGKQCIFLISSISSILMIQLNTTYRNFQCQGAIQSTLVVFLYALILSFFHH